VDPYGRVLQKTEIFERAILVGDVRLLDGRTIYGTIGDLFAYICAALTAVALLLPLDYARRNPEQPRRIGGIRGHGSR
jgi:apolipoprotein N-acyltransferase